MAKRYNIKSVEWQDEEAIGLSTAYREGGKVYVEMRVCSSVLLNGVEYIIDEVVTLPAVKSSIQPTAEGA